MRARLGLWLACAVLAACCRAGAMAYTVHVDVDSASPATHSINPFYLGCHSDSGFVHQVFGFSSQMLFGESFERPQPNVSYGQASEAWNFSVAPGAAATSTLLTATVAPAMHGASSRKVAVTKAGASTGAAAAALLHNRGLGNEGLFLEASKPYEGYFFARCAQPVSLVVQLEDTSGAGPAKLLAQWETDFQVPIPLSASFDPSRPVSPRPYTSPPLPPPAYAAAPHLPVRRTPDRLGQARLRAHPYCRHHLQGDRARLRPFGRLHRPDGRGRPLVCALWRAVLSRRARAGRGRSRLCGSPARQVGTPRRPERPQVWISPGSRPDLAPISPT